MRRVFEGELKVVFVNEDESFIRKNILIAKNPSMDEFKTKLLNTIEEKGKEFNIEYNLNEVLAKDFSFPGDLDPKSNGFLLCRMFKDKSLQLSKDLYTQIRDFNCEEVVGPLDFAKDWHIHPEQKKMLNFCGFNTAKTGLNFYGFVAMMEEMAPIYFIIYQNGNTLHAYVPHYGNPINLETNESLWYGDEYEGIDPEMDVFCLYGNIDLILQDIENAIKVL